MSKASKYKVMVGDQFLGHYSGNDPKVAVRKAVVANMPFHGNRFVEDDAMFVAYRGSDAPVYIQPAEVM